ncbi:class C sortase, partial [Streptococcus anginosus]
MKKKKQLLGLSLLLIGIALFLFPFLSMIKEDIWQSNAQRTYQQTSEKT